MVTGTQQFCVSVLTNLSSLLLIILLFLADCIFSSHSSVLFSVIAPDSSQAALANSLNLNKAEPLTMLNEMYILWGSAVNLSIKYWNLDYFLPYM